LGSTGRRERPAGNGDGGFQRPQGSPVPHAAADAAAGAEGAAGHHPAPADGVRENGCSDRSAGERRRDVDLRARVIRLLVEKSKNKRPRVLKLTGALLACSSTDGATGRAS